MIVFDIIIVILLLMSVYNGFREGILVQGGGLAGLFIGAYLAFRVGRKVGDFMGFDQNISAVAGFIIVLVGVIILVSLVSRLLRGAFKMAGLGIFDRLGGALLSAAKVWLILGLLSYGFDNLNGKTGWVRQEKLAGSFFYGPLVTTAGYTFPYIDMIRDKILIREQEENGRPAERWQQI